MADADRAILYDREWKTVGEFHVVMSDDQHATVQDGPVDQLKAGETYQISIYGRYYACTPESSGGGTVLRVNNWSRGMSTGAA